jgi:peptidoglycan hydrolase CwlO-like protein
MIIFFLLSRFTKKTADKGNGNNTESRHSENPEVVELLPPIVKLNQQIKELKLKLYRTKVKGIMKRDEQNKKIDDLQMDIFEKRTKLMTQVRSSF